jgi:hypothetical protein
MFVYLREVCVHRLRVRPTPPRDAKLIYHLPILADGEAILTQYVSSRLV